MLKYGFVAYPRSIANWRWYKNGNTFRLFFHLMLKANYCEREFENITVKRGQLVTSRKQLADETGISEQSIRTALVHLKSTNEITTRATSKFTIITIVNYEEWQSTTNISTNDQPTTNQQSTNDQPQCNNNNNIKKNNNSNNLLPLSEVERIAKLFESICVSFPKPILNEVAKAVADKEIEFDYESLFKKAERSDFLSGRNGKAERRFTVDWVISNAERIFSGMYDNPEKPRNTSYDIEELEKIDTLEYVKGVDFF